MRSRGFFKAIAGFTIIELIVVVALLAIAASIAVPIISDNTAAKKKETYRQACIYVFDQATAIADSYNKGARSLNGVSIDSVINPGGVKTVLNLDNSLAYRFNIDVKNNATNPSTNYSDKDTVVVYFAYNADKSKALAVGMWYMAKGNTTPQFKYDYSKGALASVSEAFTTPVFS